MRHALAFGPLFLLSATIAGAVEPKDGFQSARCPKPAQVPEKAEFKRLGELPPAEAFRAVLRTDEDCRGQLVQARDRLGTVPKPR